MEAIKVKQAKGRRPRVKKDEQSARNDTETEGVSEERGFGVFMFNNNSAKYEGEWEKIDNIIKRQGKGIYTEGNVRYDGEWKDDKMHGHGKFTTASGATYEGEWTDGKFQGRGKYVFLDGSIYDGDWSENKMQGFGSFTNSSTGLQFKGQFYNNSGPGLTVWYN